MVDFESAVRCLTSPIFNSLFIDFSPKQIQLSPHRTHLYLAFGEKKTVLHSIKRYQLGEKINRERREDEVFCDKHIIQR